MEEITIDDLNGTWLGNEYNLIILNQQNSSSARLVSIADNTIVETSNLQLSDTTEDNTRMLVFNDEFSIKVWSWNTPQMTLTINDNRFGVILRA